MPTVNNESVYSCSLCWLSISSSSGSVSNLRKIPVNNSRSGSSPFSRSLIANLRILFHFTEILYKALFAVGSGSASSSTCGLRHKTRKCKLPWGDEPHGSFFFAGLSGYAMNNHFQKAMLCGTLIVSETWSFGIRQKRLNF